MKSTVYIETSVVSYYTADPSRDLIIAARQQITNEWWNIYKNQYESFISPLVFEEAKAGNKNKAEKRLTALQGIAVLPINNIAEELSNLLIINGPIPKNSPEDALHIAISAVHGIDYLLTWNFKHINNAQMEKKINNIINIFGLESPTLCSPEELIGE